MSQVKEVIKPVVEGKGSSGCEWKDKKKQLRHSARISNNYILSNEILTQGVKSKICQTKKVISEVVGSRINEFVFVRGKEIEVAT